MLINIIIFSHENIMIYIVDIYISLIFSCKPW